MSTPTISRRTAWARLIVAMADDALPEPLEISFHENGHLLNIQVPSTEALTSWAEYFGARVRTPFEAHESGRWIHGAHTRDGGWNGFFVEVTAYVPGPVDPQPVDEDLTTVRALADQDITRAGEAVAGAHGDGTSATAPAEQVWTATIRQGLTYHETSLTGQTTCRRSMHAGHLIGMPEAVALGGDPCKRCWPEHDGRGAGLS